MTTASIVIPTRNRLRFLREVLASVHGQTFRDFEIVVVDHASEDGTSEWLAGRTDLRTARVEADAQRSDARNHGLELAEADFVMLLDDDDRLLPEALGKLVAALRSHPRAVAAVGAYVMFDEAGNRRRPAHPRRTMERWVWRDALFRWAATPGRILFRTDVVRQVGGFRTNRTAEGIPGYIPAGPPPAEDLDLWLRVTYRGPVVLIPDLVLEYRLHAGQRASVDRVPVVDALGSAFASSLVGKDATEAENINKARALYETGSRDLSQIQPLPALRAFREAISTYPPLLASPITRPAVVSGLAKALLGVAIGSRGIKTSRAITGAVRRRMRRDAWQAPRSKSEG